MIQVSTNDLFTFASDGVSIAIRNKGDNHILYATGVDEYGHLKWEVVNPQDAMSIANPTFILQQDVARALMDQLIRHFEGGSDTRTLRQDYLHERGRVDQLISTVSGIAIGIRPGD